MRVRIHRQHSLVVALVAFLGFAIAHPAMAVVLQPTSSFTARLIGGSNVVVGGDPENVAFKDTFIEAKEATSDRAVLEYNIQGLPQVPSAFLDLTSFNLDSPSFTNLYLYSFAGNGLVNAADYFRLDNFVTSFTDNGVNGTSFSLDITPVYNQFIAQNKSYLSFVIKNEVPPSHYARYGLQAYPTNRAVPEPTSLVLMIAAAGFALACGLRRIRITRAS
jgi:hypothetical protein